VTSFDPYALVLDLLGELQKVVRAKDHEAALDVFTEDAALLGTAAANLGRSAVSNYLAAVYGQAGYIRWDWETVSVLDVRAGAVTFLALGTVGLDDVGADDYPRDRMRLTCLAVEDGERWRLRLFHGSIPAT
jgi:uncharacterized protein (TIGR02246 family)